MSGRPNRVFTVVVLAGAALTAMLAGPSVALACNSGTSAVNVYKECVPSGGGGKSKTHRPTSPTSPSGSSGQGVGATTTQTSHLSRKASKALKHAGKDKGTLSKLVRDSGLRRHLQSQSGTRAPSAVGSAFDLGSGPTALLVVLLGAAVLLLGAGGLRGWRRLHRG